MLIPPSFATLKVLSMLKLISEILKKRLETKLMMETFLGGIMEPYRFESSANNSDEDGDN